MAMKLLVMLTTVAVGGCIATATPPTCIEQTRVGSGCCAENACGEGLTCTANFCKASVGAVCASAADCATGLCSSAKTCDATPTCNDGKRNGMETDTDCGGGDKCPACGNASLCAAAKDCTSGHCRKAKCVPPGWLIGPGGDASSVTMTKVLDQQMDDPVAIGFNPNVNGELWVTNRGDDSLTIASGIAGAAAKAVSNYADANLHFLEKVCAIAFSDNGDFGTCGDSRNDYSGTNKANDFMGPVEWPASIAEFKKSSADASKVHLDMMHDTPQCMGIAAAGGSKYYVFNGLVGTIDWYDFGKPHAGGGTDHTDGAKKRFKALGLKRVAGVPSQLALDAATGWLYIADTGNGRVVRLDTATGKQISQTKLYGDEVAQKVLTGATLEVVVQDLGKPSGMVLFEDFLYVSDTTSGQIIAISLDGTQASSLATGLPAGAIAGLAVGPDERLYFVDRKAAQVVRVDPK